MERVCYYCQKEIQIGSLKTSRTRFVQMGLIPPHGMSGTDKICAKCLQEIYEKQIKQSRIKKLKETLANDLLIQKNRSRPMMPKKMRSKK